MTIPFDCHFAQRSAGRATPGDPLMQAPVPRAVDVTEPAILDGAAVGIETTLLAERDFESDETTTKRHRILRSQIRKTHKAVEISRSRAECVRFCVSRGNIGRTALAAAPISSPRRRGGVSGKTRTRGRLKLCTPDSHDRFSVFANQSARGESQKPGRRCP